ncbi:MAG: phosphate transport system substrate-binding protein [Cyclobacteriaceae bacterium]|jgi:phosphate transport system substrate-binding protein
MKINQLVLFLIFILFISCNPSKKSKNQILTFKGSESMHSTFDVLKTEFERSQDTIKIVIEGGGSSLGLKAMKDGTADVGLSSFQFDLDDMLGSNHDVIEHVLAYDGIVIIGNKQNPIEHLTNEQVKGIFSGTITNWSQMGGSPGQIVPIIRDENSGTQRFFQEYFKIDRLNPMAVISSDNKAIVSRVNENQSGIGFIGFGYFTESIKSMDVASDSYLDSTFISPTFKNLGAGTYPLKRSLQMYYRDQNNPALTAFLDYLKTQDAYYIIMEQGLLPKRIEADLAVN